MKSLITFAVSCALPLVATCAVAGQPQETSTDSAVESVMVAQSVRQRQIDVAFAKIKTRSDLGAYLAKTDIQSSPLSALPSRERAEFLKSLKFGKTGLGSFSYGPLVESGLTVSQSRAILALFGMQTTVNEIHGLRVLSPRDQLLLSRPVIGIGDHKEYRCVERGSCSAATTYICTSNC